MPLSDNEKVNKTAHELVETFRATFHTPESVRPAHARGQLVKGSFVPDGAGASLSTAEIFSQSSVPIIARFSSATGIPDIQDNNASANPRGLAIRFVMSAYHHRHYDIILHSANGFMVRSGEDLLELFEAGKNGTTDRFLDKHPETKEFASKVPGFPKSFATEQFFGVNAFKFINRDGEETWFRYRVVPSDQEVMHFTQGEADEKGANYLYDELKNRIHQVPGLTKFKLLAQIAEAGDPLDDATKVWPETRRLMELGTIQIDTIWEEGGGDDLEQKRLIYDPVPRQIGGIEAGVDPLIDLRAAVYLISGKQRRAAAGVD